MERKIIDALGKFVISQNDRERNDFYATDPIAAEWLLKIEDLHENIWECACGDGHLGKVFEMSGHNVKATDLVQRKYGEGGVDFLSTTEPFNGDIVTNPPFKLAQQFAEHGLSLLQDGRKLCLFLKVQFLEGKSRRKMFDETPPKTVWVSSSRICCSKNGEFEKHNASTVAYAWYVWEKGYEGKTMLRWFN